MPGGRMDRWVLVHEMLEWVLLTFAVTLTMVLSDTRAVSRSASSSETAAYSPTTI